MANEQARRLRRSMTPQEVKLWVHLRAWRDLGYHFRRQAPRQDYVVDFVCLKSRLVVEVDGSQHGMPMGVSRDVARDSVLRKKEGFKVLRFWNNEVDRNLEGVLGTILATLREWPQSRPVVPPPEG